MILKLMIRDGGLQSVAKMEEYVGPEYNYANY